MTQDPVIGRINMAVQEHIDQHGADTVPPFVLLGASECEELAKDMKKQDLAGSMRGPDAVGELHFKGGGKVQIIAVPVNSMVKLAWSGPITPRVFQKVLKKHTTKERREKN